MPENINTYQNQSPTGNESPIARYYQTIADLPLNKFIEAATTGNIAALTISGFPTPEQLTNAWNVIQEEYNSAVGDHETQMRFNLWKDIKRLEGKLTQIHLIVSVLTSCFRLKSNVVLNPGIKELENELNRLMVAHFVFDVDTEEAYQKTLRKILNQSKSLKIQLDLKKSDLDSIQPEPEGEAVTKQYFINVLITLGDHRHTHLMPENITVFEFCERLRRFNKEMERKK